MASEEPRPAASARVVAMPRARVPRHLRQRTWEACLACRGAKRKCSGSVPCPPCVQRGIGSSCTIRSLRPVRRSPTPETATTLAAVAAAGMAAEFQAEPTRAPQAWLGTSMPSFTPRPLPEVSSPPRRYDRRRPSHSTSRPSGPGPIELTTSISPSESRTTDLAGPATAQTSPRMLRSSTGEQLYIGEGASLSFLQLVRGLVSEQIGPSPFSHNETKDTMLEKASSGAGRASLVPASIELGQGQKCEFLHSFHSVTQGLLDVIEPSEIDHLLSDTQPYVSTQKRAAFDLVMAIGAQCDSSEATRNQGLDLFRNAQRHAFACLLEDPCIDMVRTFLLMAFYLLGECRRNTAFMYLGIATRAAVTLGLHSPATYANMSSPDNRLRLRVWMSLHIVDKLANAILGRPAATAGILTDLAQPINMLFSATERGAVVALAASYHIVSIIHHIVDTIYDKKMVTIAAIQQILDEIELWSLEIPQSFRSPPNSETARSCSNQEDSSHNAIGKIHVSCLYYFAVTLATRPVLVSTITSQAEAPPEQPQVSLSSSCLDAAMFLIQTCVGAQKAGLLYHNMCILKALVFPAGLILGFESFAKTTAEHSVETASQGAREVLAYFASVSPQAAHYLDILTSLSVAIAERRQMRAAMATSRNRRYVSRLFSFGEDSRNKESTRSAEEFWRTVGMTSPNPSPSAVEAPPPPMSANAEPVAEWSASGQQTMGEGGDLLLDFDSLDIFQWDNFPHMVQ